MTDSTYLTGLNNRPTPETDAMIETDAHRIEEYSAPLTAYRRMCELARTLERERDEAREVIAMYKESKANLPEYTSRRELKRQLAEAREQRDRLAEALNDLWHYYSLTDAAYALIDAALTSMEGGTP